MHNNRESVFVSEKFDILKWNRRLHFLTYFFAILSENEFRHREKNSVPIPGNVYNLDRSNSQLTSMFVVSNVCGRVCVLLWFFFFFTRLPILDTHVYCLWLFIRTDIIERVQSLGTAGERENPSTIFGIEFFWKNFFLSFLFIYHFVRGVKKRLGFWMWVVGTLVDYTRRTS